VLRGSLPKRRTPLSFAQAIRRFSRNIWLLYFASAIVSFNYFGIYAVLFNLYLLRLDYDPPAIGLINGTGLLALATGSLPAGLLGRKLRPRRAMLVGAALMTLGTGLIPLSEFVPAELRLGWLLSIYAAAWLGGALHVVFLTGAFLVATGALFFQAYSRVPRGELAHQPPPAE
jgi:MFS family permease